MALLSQLKTMFVNFNQQFVDSGVAITKGPVELR